MSINTRIELIVKEGPGEITGKTLLELDENDSIEFDDIQFTEPGKYIIQAIPENNEKVEQKEFTINIEDEDIIEQEDSGSIEDDDTESLKGGRPIIKQIFEPSIKLAPFEFEKSNNEDDNIDIASSLGYTPFLGYNGIQIRTKDIIKMFLYYEDLIPKCRVTFRDTQGFINSQDGMPLSDTKFDIFLNSGSPVLKSIHLKFKISEFKKNKRGTNTFIGVISFGDFEDFYDISNKTYKNDSFTVLKKVAKEVGLGYNSNVNSTDDEMTWRRKRMNYQDFIKSVVKKSYISDDSFVSTYIDFYYSLNYVDIEKEWNRDISKDLALNTQGVSSLNGEAALVPMTITNDPSQDTSEFSFLSNYKLLNNSTDKNIKEGMFSKSRVYNRETKQFEKFDINSQDSSGDVVILKGAPADSLSYKESSSAVDKGRKDNDNVHKNFLYSEELNKRNFSNLTKVTCIITMTSPNYNIYLYQKINVVFVNQIQTVTNNYPIDERLSGEWMVVDISFNWLNGTLRQKLAIARKELGKTTLENNTEVVAEDKTVDNSEINDNPIDEDIENETINDTGFIFGDEIPQENENENQFSGLDENTLNGDVISDENEIDNDVFSGDQFRINPIYTTDTINLESYNNVIRILTLKNNERTLRIFQPESNTYELNLNEFGVGEYFLEVTIRDKTKIFDIFKISEPDYDNYWRIEYLNEVKLFFKSKKTNALFLTKNKANEYSETIKKYVDNEKSLDLYLYLSKFKDKTNVSSVSSSFYNLYNKDFYSYLKENLSEGNFNNLVSYTDKLNNYTIKD